MTITVKTQYAIVRLTDDAIQSMVSSQSNTDATIKLLKEAAAQVKELSKLD